MNSRLLIISDLFGFKNKTWIHEYVSELENVYEVVLYDSMELAEIENKKYSQKELHDNFMNGGLEKAVENLTRLENEFVDVLGFSIGGTIAWKAGLAGLKIRNLMGVSSTRLRLETRKPNCKIQLLFGDEDEFKPSKKWFNDLDVEHKNIKDFGHDFYAGVRNVERIKRNFKL